jgi:hypothetical protein
MTKSSERVINWRKRTKERIVQAFGNKCGICDYAKCDEALDLHHLDPSQKEFSMASIRAWPKSWDKIVIELRKCVLLCCRCHREVHAGISNVPENIQQFDEAFADYKTLEKLDRQSKNRKQCPVCGTDMFNRSTTCSLACAAKLKGKFDWDKIDLNQLYAIEHISISRIAKTVGCSNSAVIKRLKKLKFY